MISGRGFIGIAAQSLGMGRPVLTPIWALIFGAACAVGAVQGFGRPPQLAAMLPYVITKSWG